MSELVGQRVVEKIWGREKWIINDENHQYCHKKLEIKKGAACSLHMHEIKLETFTLESGKVQLILGDEVIDMFPGDSETVRPGVYHSFCGYCFPKNTKILIRKTCIRNGGKFEVLTTKNINELIPGEEVLSYNVETGKKETKKILNVFERKSDNFVTLKLSNGNELRCTTEHPIAVVNNVLEWKNACDINIGDKLIQKTYPSLSRRIQGISQRGKTFEEHFGVEKADRIKNNMSISDNTIRNTEEYRENKKKETKDRWGGPNSIYKTDEYSEKLSVARKKDWKNPESGYNTSELLTTEGRREIGLRNKSEGKCGLVNYNKDKKGKKLSEIYGDKAEEVRANHSRATKKLWANEEYCKKQAISRDLKPNGLEVEFDNLINGENKEWDYVGDFSLWINGCNPDFIHKRFDKVIEVFEDVYYKPLQYGSVSNYVNTRKEKFDKWGYDSLFVTHTEVYDSPGLVKDKVKEFTYNPDVEIVQVIGIEYDQVDEDVYNIEVEDNNNYFAQGILVHNCDSVITEVSTFHKDSDSYREWESHLNPIIYGFDIDGTLEGSDTDPGAVTSEHISDKEFVIVSSRSRSRSQEACDRMGINPLKIYCCRVNSRAEELKRVDRDFPLRRTVYIGDLVTDKEEALLAGWDFYFPDEFVSLCNKEALHDRAGDPPNGGMLHVSS